MSFKGIAQIAGSAMSAQTVRMNTVASNLANAGTADTEDSAYRARKPVFAAVYQNAGARVQVLDVIQSDEPLNARHEPGHPMANDEGMVYYSNVSAVEEMTDMMAASRAYSTSIEVLSRINGMQQELLKMGQS
jgi:flagellar basal-body rod protein FlgC